MSVARNSAMGMDAPGEQGAATTGVLTIATGDLRDQVLTADGASVLVSDTSGLVTRYDLASGAATGSWQVGSSLGGMAVSADGHYLYATELTPGTGDGGYPQTNTAEIDRLDLRSGAVSHFDIPLTGYSTLVFRDVAVESNGKLLLTVDASNGYGNDAIYEFDPNAGSSTATRLGGYYGLYDGVLQGTADGAHIAIADAGYNDSHIYLRSVTSGTTVSGYGPDGTRYNGGAIAVAADGSLVAHGGVDYDSSTSSYTINSVVIFNAALQSQTDLAQVAPQAIGDLPVAGLAFSADGANLFVLNSSLDAVVELSTSTWSIEAVIPVDRTPVGPIFATAPGVGDDLSPFGDRLLASADGHWLTVQTDGEVQVIDLTRTTPTPVLTTLSFPTAVTVGPDGGNLFITAGATDATSTVQSVTITLDHALATADGAVTQITFSADHDAFDDSFSAVNLALTGTATGTYAVIGATVTDAAGHSVTYDEAALDALLPTTTFTVTAEQTLTDGDDTYHDTFGQGLIVHGLGGNDTLYGSSTTDTLDGGAGDDTLVQGPGATTFIGGNGVDTVVLGGNARDYYEVHSGDGSEIVLLGRNGSAAQTITEDVEHVRFAGGTAFTSDNKPDSDYSAPGTVTGDYTINAPAEGYYTFNGGSGDNEVFLPGNVSDYTLSRGYFEDDGPINYYSGGSAGNFNLTNSDGSTIYSFDESVDTIHFANGQYLSLKDLPGYVAGSAAVDVGSSQDDILYQTKVSGYEAFVGYSGHDDLYLGGNVSDYTARAVFGVLNDGYAYVDGIELVGKNGSGALLIDSTVDTVHFQNGQYLAFGDIGAYVDAAPATDAVFHLLADTSTYAEIDGAAYTNDVLLLDGNVGDYTLQRGYQGSFELYGKEGGLTTIDQNVETVQFGNGQSLALHDLPAYVTGNAVFTSGTSADDLLYTPLSGDQYVVGGDGIDNLYLNGNINDYTLQSVHLAAGYDYHAGNYQYHPQIDGVELVGTNGSGNIYIDGSVETVHFQNGQYLAYQDLGAYIHGIG